MFPRHYSLGHLRAYCVALLLVLGLSCFGLSFLRSLGKEYSSTLGCFVWSVYLVHWRTFIGGPHILCSAYFTLLTGDCIEYIVLNEGDQILTACLHLCSTRIGPELEIVFVLGNDQDFEQF